MRLGKFLLVLAAGLGTSVAQTEPQYLEDILKTEILSKEVAISQLRSYILGRVAKPPEVSSATQWTADSKRIRGDLLKDVVFHGWPKEWVESPAKFEDLGVLQGDGFRLRRLRYEIIPGFQSVALLYEPLNLHGKVPAILNVNGHVGAPGKSTEYEQKRNITFARNGILALSLEWFSCGELATEPNQHWYGAHLDLVGVNELGLFYLAMRRGLDFLYDHPETDRSRIGMTGLSGGGWQTILLSSLDERINAAAPVAGFSSIVPRVEAAEYGDIGDIEQSATDLFDGRDYSWLAALRAPRPTLLTYNAEDDCCFRAAMVKRGVFDAVRPFFRLYDTTSDLAWHENRDPGTHNYQIDNRRATYEFFSRHFNLPAINEDPGIGSAIRSYSDLVIGLPSDNLSILGLAQKLAGEVKRDELPTKPSGLDAERSKLKGIVRYRPAKVERVWMTGVTKRSGVESESHIFAMADGLASNGIWLRAIDAPGAADATIILDDNGKRAASVRVTDRVNRGEQVLAVDLPFQGDAWADDRTWLLGQMIYTTGDRPLGIEAAHLIELAHWLKSRGASQVRLETSGMRTQLVALVTAAVEPSLFSEVVVRRGIPSLRYLVDKPVKYKDASDLFCLDLYKFTDLDRLVSLAGPTKVRTAAD
jgi:hypothetical protein